MLLFLRLGFFCFILIPDDFEPRCSNEIVLIKKDHTGIMDDADMELPTNDLYIFYKKPIYKKLNPPRPKN